MAILRPTVEFNFEPLLKLAKIFPELNGRLLALVGKRSRVLLKEKYLSGQELDLRKFPTDKRGRFTVTSNVNKRRTFTKIASYPVNLFERGRGLRSGAREPGRFIITKKLKQDVAARIGSYTSEFERRILEPELNKIGAS